MTQPFPTHLTPRGTPSGAVPSTAGGESQREPAVGGAVIDYAIFEKADDDQIEQWVADLPRDLVVERLQFITTLRKALYHAEKMATSRIEHEQILGSGEVWTSPDGRDFMWTADRERKCADPEGLRAALAPIVATSESALAARAFREAFKPQPPKVYLLELDKVVRFAPDAESTVRDFVSWAEGKTKKLRPLDEEGR